MAFCLLSNETYCAVVVSRVWHSELLQDPPFSGTPSAHDLDGVDTRTEPRGHRSAASRHHEVAQLGHTATIPAEREN